jgi:sugar/nucleoside kinase (ribokinase family)
MARIVVVGSVAQDAVVWLRQPLVPGRHLDSRQRKVRLGGGAVNTAVPLRHAGHQVALVSPVGADTVGEWLIAKVQATGIDCASLARVQGESTRSLVLVDPDGERTIVNESRCRELAPPVRVRALQKDALYVRSRETDLQDLLREEAKTALVVAHVPPLAAGSRPAQVLVGSESDLPRAFLSRPFAAAREIAGDVLQWVVLTRGGNGAAAFSARERIEEPAPAVSVLDTTAAGDVFAAGLVHGLVTGRPMADALRIAVSWGAAAVTCPGLPDAQTIRDLA